MGLDRSPAHRRLQRRPGARLTEAPSAQATIDRVFREESGRAVATLIRVLGDFDLAEEAVQDAFAKALEVWPERGVPDNPGAWLMATAKHRAIDQLRRDKRFEQKTREIGHVLEIQGAKATPDLEAAIEAGRRLIELEPDDALSHTNLSILYQRRGMIPEAEEEKAIAMQIQMKQQARGKR